MIGVVSGPMGNPAALSNPVAFLTEGATPATSGWIRWSTGAKGIRWRDAADTIDQRVFEIDASGNVYIGVDGTFAGATQAPQVAIYATTAVGLGLGGTTMLYLIGGNVECWKPHIGGASANSPWGAINGQATVAVAAANITLSAAQYSRAIQKFTGAPAAARTITYPHPASEDESYVKYLRGEQTVSPLTIATGTGTTASLAVGTMHGYLFTPDGVRLLT